MAKRQNSSSSYSAQNEVSTIAPAKGKLGVMIPGMGAVATTFVAGVHAVRKGIGQPIGSVTQMGTIRLGKRTDGRSPLIKDFVPLAKLDDLVFTGWDPIPDDMYAAARKAGVLDRDLVDKMKPFLSSIKPRKAVFDHEWVKKLNGTHVKKGKTKMDLVEQVRDDIRDFRKSSKADRLIMMWCGSTEVFVKASEVHSTLKAFEKGLQKNDEHISPSMIYAYAALTEGIPFANGAPNLTVDFPVMHELSRNNEAPICGKDFKTGQTLMKTILAPGFKARMLGLNGWFSTNILGNRDGEVLDDPGSFKTKEESKLSALDHILQPKLYPKLYGNFYHAVRINYYPPRGDAKEGWDNIDIFGWLGYPMQIKINFLCRDSILAAPLVLDLV
ncbi:MAG: inositol-3-phosphate synthase, partial [Terriglobales bacterium]